MASPSASPTSPRPWCPTAAVIQSMVSMVWRSVIVYRDFTKIMNTKKVAAPFLCQAGAIRGEGLNP